MKLTELVTALEDYKQLVQNVIDPLNALVSVNVSLGLAQPIALPPPSHSRTAGAAAVRKYRTPETCPEGPEGEAPIESRRKDLRQTSRVRTRQAGPVQAVRSRLCARMGPEKESREIQLGRCRAEAS
jgi:hypothetical protein